MATIVDTTTQNFFNALTAAELAAAASPLLAALNNVKNGDGSVQSLTGQGIVLEAQMIAILPTLQKIGVQNVAGFLIDFINEKIASVTPAPVAAAPAPVAAAPVQIAIASPAASGGAS